MANSDQPSIYQLFIVAVPVLSLDEVYFLDGRRQRSDEKKPTVLPRWVLSFNFNRLASAVN